MNILATSTAIGFESKLWTAADALRNNMDAAEYKHVALALLFLKCIPDAFEAKHAELEAQQSDGADPEDSDRSERDEIDDWVRSMRASADNPSASAREAK